VNDIQKWQVRQFAENGGFSDRYITAHVFHKSKNKLNEIDDELIALVTRYRLKIRALLTDWRCGRTTRAKAHAEAATSSKKAQRIQRKKAG